MFWTKDNRFPYYFPGQSNGTILEIIKTFAKVNKINTNLLDFNSIGYVYGIYFDVRQNIFCFVMFPREAVHAKNIVNIAEFIGRFYNHGERPWYLDLEAGSTVTIKDLDWQDDGLYPFGLNEDMARDSKMVFRIRSKNINYLRIADAMTRVAFNGDIYEYELLLRPWLWHSSMFEVPDTKPIEKIQLTSLNISL